MLIVSLVEMSTRVTNIVGITQPHSNLQTTDRSLINAGLISLCLRSSPTFREMKTGHKSMFNSLPDPSTVCAQSQLIFVP